MPKQTRQPTHAEMVAVAKQMGLQKSPEDLEKAQKGWENKFNTWFNDVSKPIENQNSKDNLEWGGCKSYNDSLTPEELAKRNMYIDENE